MFCSNTAGVVIVWRACPLLKIGQLYSVHMDKLYQ